MTKMKQQDRQKATRTARMTKGIQQEIPDDLVIFAEKTKDRIDKNFGEFMRKRGKSNVSIVHEMHPIIGDATHVSKMLNGTVHVSLEILVALHYLYGHVFEDDLQAKITITDNGKGISPDHLPHIFERMYQCDQSRSAGGNGLGLSIVKELVTAHKGKITVDSTPNKGSTFTLLFPKSL